MNKYHFFVVYICVSRDQLLKFPWRHLVLFSLAMLKKTHNNCFSATKYAKRWMNEKTIQCLPNPSQHLPVYAQQFPSYFHVLQPTFLFPLETPLRPSRNMFHGLWMERQFNACQTPRSMYLSILNSFRVIRCLSQCVTPKIAIFTTFLFPLVTPLGQSR